MVLTTYLAKEFEHTHERQMFDELLSKLKPIFEDSEASLVGNFSCGGSEVDACLFKEDAIIVIEIKDYSGKIVGGEEGAWTVDDVEIKGRKRNPYRQVRAYKFGIKGQLDNKKDEIFGKQKASTIDLYHISAVVLFRDKAEYDEHQLPSNIRKWFYVSDIQQIDKLIPQITSKKMGCSSTEIKNILNVLNIDESMHYPKKHKVVSQQLIELEPKPNEKPKVEEINIADAVKQDELSAKLRYYYSGYVVDKGIANMQDIRRVPKFVSEHLLTRVSSESDEKAFNEKLMNIIELINTLYPEAKDKDVILDKVIIRGKDHKIIDELKVEVDEKHEIRISVVPSLNLRNVMILDSVVDANPQLLSTGIWGLATIRHTDPLVDEKGNKLTLPVLIEKFNPFHVSDVNIDEFINHRENLTTDEWIDALINTIGLNPEVYTQRQKLLLISRFVPLVENNINLMEFGPRATGKTYFYRNVSFYTRIISGGKITPAQLFYHISRRTVGEIGLKDSIVFDEIAKLRFSDPSEMMGKLKDYMVDGHFERGPKKGTSLCSLVFMGNIDIRPSESGFIPIEDINYKLPDFMRGDTAFLDRIHGVLPGWEVAKIRKSEVHLSKNYGFSVDFFSEILHELRKVDFTPIIRSSVKLENVTIRDEIGIYRLAAGFTKILFSNQKFSQDDLKMVMDIVVEYRQKIADLLHKMAPGEFGRKIIHYKITEIL